LSYKLQYVDGLKPKEKWYFSFGSTLHTAVEHFFKVSTPPPPSLEELLQFYEDNWLPQGFESKEDELKHKEFGKQILTRFWEIHTPDFRIPVALERSFMLDIEGIKIRGFIDRVDKLDSGGLSIIDYKTNQELFTTDYLKNNLQLTIYQMAAQQTWNLQVEMLTLYHLRTNTPLTCPPRGKKQIDETRQLVLDVAENIVKGNFPATENNFCPCDFAEHCPFYRHQYIITTPQPDVQKPLPGIAAAEAVEKYAALDAQLKELQEDLEEVRQLIINYCQAEGLNRVFGSENEITYKIVEKTGFNEEDIKAILEPAGWWEKVLGFEPARLKELLKDESVSFDIKKKIKSLQRVVSSYPQLRLKKRSAEEEE
jgi:putative RecB family exonuclease